MKTGALCDFPLPEADALLKRLDGQPLLPSEAEAAERGRNRLAQAVAVETGASGHHESGIESIAHALIGEPVRLETNYGKVLEGELEKVTGFRSVVIKDEPFSHPVNLSLVRTIEPVEQAVAA
jgi:hypothetical protein